MRGYKTTPLKILMTADTVGGVWTYCMEICKALQPYNVHFSVVTTGAKLTIDQWEQVHALPNVKVYETDYLLEWMENPWRDIDESGDYLLQLEQEIQPDIVHLNCYAYGSLEWKAPVIMVAHSDVYSWWRSVRNDDPPAEWNEYFFRVKKGLDNADMLIAPSTAMLLSIHNIYAPSTDCKVIYNARNPGLFYKKPKLQTVMSMGRIWDEAKNVKLLVEASYNINYDIKIAGETQFEQNSIEVEHDNIHYLGRLTNRQIADELASAAIYVLPAKYEPFGLSALEAALSGCALVLGDIPSLREIWQEHAVYVNTGDAGALAETINRLMRSKKTLHQFATNAHSHAQQFAPQILAHQYMEVYKQQLQRLTIKAETA
jgi:glycogen synthase